MLAHICGQHCLYNPLSEAKILIPIHMLKDISLFICKAKSSRHMMVLKDGCIVILDCPGVLGLDEEVLIAAKVLEVMYGG